MRTPERDSAKDEAVVFIFIFATVGLLGYAAVRPWVEQWAEVSLVLLAYCRMMVLTRDAAEIEGKADVYPRLHRGLVTGSGGHFCNGGVMSFNTHIV